MPQLRLWHTALLIGLMSIALKWVVETQFEGIESGFSYLFMGMLTLVSSAAFYLCEHVPLTRRVLDQISAPPSTDIDPDTTRTVRTIMAVAPLIVFFLIWLL